jgi:hypothetical protein
VHGALVIASQDPALEGHGIQAGDEQACALAGIRRAHWCQTTEQRGISSTQGVRPLPKGREKGPRRQGHGRPTSEAFSASRIR